MMPPPTTTTRARWGRTGSDMRAAASHHPVSAARSRAPLALALLVALAAGACRPRAEAPTPPPPRAPPAAPAAEDVGPRRPAIALGFDRAKRVAAREVYADHRVEAYCGCTFTELGDIDPTACGYVPRGRSSRTRRMEWEHVVPAKRLGGHLACWRGETDGCKTAGKKGRECCSRSAATGGDPLFHAMEGDLHNLVPAVGELNGDRSDRPYGTVEGEPRDYGRCDFEIDRAAGRGGVAEPPDAIRGDVARVWLYAVDVWGLTVTPVETSLLEQWSEADPVDAWERERDRRIEHAQGNRNHRVH